MRNCDKNQSALGTANKNDPVKIIFFDVDGTLLKMGAREAAPAVLDALQQLKDSGVKLVLATGRAPFKAPDIGGIEFDALIAYNGALVMDGDKVISMETIPETAIERVVENTDKIGRPMVLAMMDGFSANGCDANLKDYFGIAHTPIAKDPAFEEKMKEPVFQIMASCTPDEWDGVMEGADGAALTAWWNRAADIIPASCSKGNAVRSVLEYFSISADQSMAFGDGLNDVPMLEAVGCGVAMENAGDEVKEKADATAPDVNVDGVALFLQQSGLIR